MARTARCHRKLPATDGTDGEGRLEPKGGLIRAVNPSLENNLSIQLHDCIFPTAEYLLPALSSSGLLQQLQSFNFCMSHVQSGDADLCPQIGALLLTDAIVKCEFRAKDFPVPAKQWIASLQVDMNVKYIFSFINDTSRSGRPVHTDDAHLST